MSVEVFYKNELIKNIFIWLLLCVWANSLFFKPIRIRGVNASDLRTVHSEIELVEFADDTNVVVVASKVLGNITEQFWKLLCRV